MDRHEYDMVLGRLAVHFKVLTKTQVGEALKRRRLVDESMALGPFLVQEQYVTTEVLAKLDRAREQYLKKQGLSPPDPGDQTQPVAPEAPGPAPEPSPLAITIDPPKPAQPQTLVVDPVVEPILTPDSASAGEAPIAVQPTPVPVAATPVSVAATPVPVAATPVPVAATPVPVAATAPTPAVTPAAAAPPTPGPVQVGQGEHLLHVDATTTLSNLLHQAQQLGASDLHLHSTAPIRLRLNGSMRDAGPAIDSERSRELVFGLLTEDQRRVIEEQLQLDFSYEIPGIGRFRSNAYKQQRGWDAVFRVIPANPPSLAELGLPDDLERVVSFHQGMVLFTGPAGCGKSSTMAAMVHLLNHKRPDHILTVEDPVEYVHKSAECLINQREVGHHTESFARALRAALREDPDIIVIGELRDLETIELALTAAETGHLVLGTLHTSNAIRTINRLLGVFPPEQQNQIRTMVSESLRAVVSQRLVPSVDGERRVPALEVLMNSKAVGNLIREKKTFQIASQMQTGARQGMVMLDNSLADLVKQGEISVEEARRNAEDPKRFA